MELKYEISRWWERLLIKLVWRLPKFVVRWSFIRVVSFATTGKYENQVTPELTALDALDRWENERG